MSIAGKEAAFPVPGLTKIRGQAYENVDPRPGMTLRQWYMGQLAPAIIDTLYRGLTPRDSSEATRFLLELPNLAPGYTRALADAMIAKSIE